MRVKLMVAFIIAAGAAAIFLLSGTSSNGKSVYYYSPTEFLAKPEMMRERLRLKGKIESGSVALSTDKLDLAFRVTDGQKSLPVHYHGPVPESFQEGLEVVVDGRMAGGGVFEGHELIVKCPSKYESGTGGAKPPGAGPPAPAHPEGVPLK